MILCEFPSRNPRLTVRIDRDIQFSLQEPLSHLAVGDQAKITQKSLKNRVSEMDLNGCFHGHMIHWQSCAIDTTSYRVHKENVISH